MHREDFTIKISAVEWFVDVPWLTYLTALLVETPTINDFNFYLRQSPIPHYDSHGLK